MISVSPESGHGAQQRRGDAALIVSTRDNYPGEEPGVNTALLPSLIIWNVECKTEFKIVKVTLCVMDLKGRGVTSLARRRDLSNAEKLKHSEYSPFHGKTCFFGTLS